MKQKKKKLSGPTASKWWEKAFYSITTLEAIKSTAFGPILKVVKINHENKSFPHKDDIYTASTRTFLLSASFPIYSSRVSLPLTIKTPVLRCLIIKCVGHKFFHWSRKKCERKQHNAYFRCLVLCSFWWLCFCHVCIVQRRWIRWIIDRFFIVTIV